MKIHLTAGEASGDLLGREVIDALRQRDPSLDLAGIGGPEMAAAGIDSPFDISPLSVMGITEAVGAYSTVKRLVHQAADHIIAFAPDVAVLIDSWGFTIRLAKTLRARAPHIRLVKLVGPQVWASRPGRAKEVAAHFDHLLAITDMELPFYEDTGLPVTMIGTPALSRSEPGDANAFRATEGIAGDTPILLILPGSRPSEIDRVAPVLMDAATEIKSARPDITLVAAPAANITDRFKARYGDTPGVRIIDDPARRFDAMAASTVVLACSGTVTSEVALQGAPMVVGYKLGWITWAIARALLYRYTHITLINIAAGDRPIVPECVQTRFTPRHVAAETLKLLDDPTARAAQVAAQTKALDALRIDGAPAADRAADAILTVPTGRLIR